MWDGRGADYLGRDTLGLVLNELVSNCMKHGFPEGNPGAISVGLYRKEKEITLTVADTGGRFPTDFDITNTKSLGLQLVTALAKQLDATINLFTKNQTEFEIRFAE